MNSLISIESIDTIAIDSREVAEMIAEKEHKELLRDIRKYVEHLNEGGFPPVDFFIESTYKDIKGEERPCYEVTRKGCEFIANKLVGKKGTLFTAKFITRFHEMEDHINNNQVVNDLSPELQAIIFHDRQIQEVKSKVSEMEPKVLYLQNTMTVDYGQQHELNLLAKEVVVRALGGKYANAYKTLNRKAFQSMWHSYQHYFRVNSYRNTPSVKYDEAMDYIANWKPDYNLQLEIENENRMLLLTE